MKKSLILIFVMVLVSVSFVLAGECNDSLDNDKDGKIDFDGKNGTMPDMVCGSLDGLNETVSGELMVIRDIRITHPDYKATFHAGSGSRPNTFWNSDFTKVVYQQEVRPIIDAISDVRLVFADLKNLINVSRGTKDQYDSVVTEIPDDFHLTSKTDAWIWSIFPGEENIIYGVHYSTIRPGVRLYTIKKLNLSDISEKWQDVLILGDDEDGSMGLMKILGWTNDKNPQLQVTVYNENYSKGTFFIHNLNSSNPTFEINYLEIGFSEICNPQGEFVKRPFFWGHGHISINTKHRLLIDRCDTFDANNICIWDADYESDNCGVVLLNWTKKGGLTKCTHFSWHNNDENWFICGESNSNQNVAIIIPREVNQVIYDGSYFIKNNLITKETAMINQWSGIFVSPLPVIRIDGKQAAYHSTAGKFTWDEYIYNSINSPWGHTGIFIADLEYVSNKTPVKPIFNETDINIDGFTNIEDIRICMNNILTPDIYYINCSKLSAPITSSDLNDVKEIINNLD